MGSPIKDLSLECSTFEIWSTADVVVELMKTESAESSLFSLSDTFDVFGIMVPNGASLSEISIATAVLDSAVILDVGVLG